ncbi:MAG: hypothetical protein HYY06_14105 [Deltaproteobacteria bacterium]|nr:hypothetical protein [Deltaproteobacteria bacterium]
MTPTVAGPVPARSSRNRRATRGLGSTLVDCAPRTGRIRGKGSEPEQESLPSPGGRSDPVCVVGPPPNTSRYASSARLAAGAASTAWLGPGFLLRLSARASQPLRRTHDVRGLYIVDGSVLPTTPAADPSLTIIASSLRVARDIAERWSEV